MEEKADQADTIRNFVQWATTLPQSIAVYFICVVLIGGIAFYAGTLAPKRSLSTTAPPVSAPRN
jgi:hypothetical protein